MQINNNYIVWTLILVSIFIGSFLIVAGGFVRIDFSDSRINALELPAKGVETPEIVRAVYLTSISAGSSKKIDWLIDLAKKSELNAVVIDIKDYSGFVAYDSAVPETEIYKTERRDIRDINALIGRLHENNIYAIARVTVFQDPALVKARPGWAVKNKYTGRPWADRKGLTWIDPTNKEAWKYFSDISKDALVKGFDEINFDYIRFPSDGDTEAMVFANWDRAKVTRPMILNQFFKYMRDELGDAKMSADLFGFVTTRKEDFGVGQVIEDAFQYFDYVSPMVYPSHYPAGFMGFANPAQKPYEVIYQTVKSGAERLEQFRKATGDTRTNLRPWLQDFNLGADYTQAMVEAEIKAAQDAMGEDYNGYMLWNARNVYHDGIFIK